MRKLYIENCVIAICITVFLVAIVQCCRNEDTMGHEENMAKIAASTQSSHVEGK